MVTESRDKGIWVQCTQCGEIYYLDEPVPIDRLYVTSICPRCGNERGQNCGDKEEDIYYYYNSDMDPRYYQY